MRRTVKYVAMAETSIQFIKEFYNFTQMFSETEAFVKTLVCEHIIQYPTHSSSKAFLHILEKRAQKVRKRDVWMTPPFTIN